MISTPDIALSFLAVKDADLTFVVHRKKLDPEQVSVPGTRYLPEDCTSQHAIAEERERYEVSLQPKAGFEEARVSAWINQGLTDEVLHQALVTRTRQTDLVGDAELPDRSFIR